MTKKQHYFLALTTTIILSLIGPVIFAVEKIEHKSAPQPIMIFFYANGCPHCATVEEFMQKNDLTQHFTIDQREIHTGNNSNLLSHTLEKCQVTAKVIELPILWTGTNCVLGDDNIISFFKKELQCQKANKEF